MASGDTKTEALLNILGNGGDASDYKGCCNTKTQSYILDAIDRVQNVEDEVEELKNNPDVVDIVDTYADLQAYDKSTLTDKDIIRVLEDSTHSNKSTYYRYSASTDSFTYIGEAGGGGVEYVDLTITGATQTGFTVSAEKTKGEVIDLAKDDKNVIFRVNVPSGYSQILHGYYELPLFNYTDGGVDDNVVAMTLLKLVNDFYDVVFGYDVGAGTVSTGTISILVTPAAPNVVQTTGTSTTDVMSQNAVTSMVFADPANKYSVQIGSLATGSSPNHSVAIGNSIRTSTESVTIGENASTTGSNQIAIGRGATVNNANARGCIALGDQTVLSGSEHGVMSIAPSSTSYGYNSTNYRLLTGLYDPVNAHDAATKGYVDGLVGNVAAALNAINNGTQS